MSLKQHRFSQQGFTLIEILVALSVFAVMAVLTYGGMDRMVNFQEQVDTTTQRLENWQMAFSTMQNDLEQAVNRPVRDNLGSFRPAFLSNPNNDVILELTTHIRSDFQLRHRMSSLQRVEYRIEDNQLLRDSWQTLDRAHNAEPQTRVMMEGIEAIEFAFIDEQEFNFWPKPGNSLVNQALPIAVRVTVTMKNALTIERLFLVRNT